MKQLLALLALVTTLQASAQSLYFPPLTGTTWDTLSPQTLGWCPDRIDSMYSYLDARNTDAFIVLKGGKIVLEKYFGTFTADSVHYWASASKSLTALMVGIAQEQGMLTISDKVSSLTGPGWTSATTAQESKITVHNLLTMTSGLNDTVSAPCTNEDTTAICLRYLADTGSRWAYHTGAYRKLLTVLSAVSGSPINTFTNTWVNNHTGMTGTWYDGVYYSKPRSMARFGLLALNHAIWNSDTLLHDTTYFHNMLNISQSYNQSYGYLWWLNGKSSYMSPGAQFVFPGSLIPNAPAEMICALGKNDQKIYIVPSQQLVVVRVGGSAYGVALAFSPFDDELWGKIDSLGYGCNTGIGAVAPATPALSVYPNPAMASFTVSLPGQYNIEVYDMMGRKVDALDNITNTASVNSMAYPAGVYIIKVISSTGSYTQRIEIRH